MNNFFPIAMENHRSRERIKKLGEVFTPERYIKQMLALTSHKIWSDENTIFFEPSCGHGNIVLAILEKRILALKEKYTKANLNKPTLHAVANAINTLWAIDICPVNVELTRKRIFSLLVKSIENDSYELQIVEMRDFLAHILCTLIWQTQHNETLSALSAEPIAESQAGKTKLGNEWIKIHRHKPIDFSLDWCTFYKQSKTTKTASLLFRRAQQFLKFSSMRKTVPGYEDFCFANETLEALFEKRQSISTKKEVSC